MPKITRKQRHHITYTPEWIVPLTGWQHKAVTHLQNMKATQDNINQVTGFVNAVIYEWQRLHYQYYEAKKGNLNP